MRTSLRTCGKGLQGMRRAAQTGNRRSARIGFAVPGEPRNVFAGVRQSAARPRRLISVCGRGQSGCPTEVVMGRYEEVFRRSLQDPEGFWAEQAAALRWRKR